MDGSQTEDRQPPDRCCPRRCANAVDVLRDRPLVVTELAGD